MLLYHCLVQMPLSLSHTHTLSLSFFLSVVSPHFFPHVQLAFSTHPHTHTPTHPHTHTHTHTHTIYTHTLPEYCLEMWWKEDGYDAHERAPPRYPCQWHGETQRGLGGRGVSEALREVQSREEQREVCSVWYRHWTGPQQSSAVGKYAE